MRAGAQRSRPSTSPATYTAAKAAELGLQRLSFSENLRAEVEATRPEPNSVQAVLNETHLRGSG